MEKKRDKKTLKRVAAVVVVLTVFSIFTMSFRADALLHGFGSRGNYVNSGIAGTAGSGMEHVVIKALSELRLTDEQKKEIADILKKYQQAVRDNALSVMEARKSLFEAIHKGTYDEDAVRNASKNVAYTEEEFAVLRAQMVSEIAAVLTSEQIAVLEQIKADISGNISKRIEQMQYLIDLWIESHS